MLKIWYWPPRNIVVSCRYFKIQLMPTMWKILLLMIQTILRIISSMNVFFYFIPHLIVLIMSMIHSFNNYLLLKWLVHDANWLSVFGKGLPNLKTLVSNDRGREVKQGRTVEFDLWKSNPLKKFQVQLQTIWPPDSTSGGWIWPL